MGRYWRWILKALGARLKHDCRYDGHTWHTWMRGDQMVSGAKSELTHVRHYRKCIYCPTKERRDEWSQEWMPMRPGNGS